MQKKNDVAVDALFTVDEIAIAVLQQAASALQPQPLTCQQRDEDGYLEPPLKKSRVEFMKPTTPLLVSCRTLTQRLIDPFGICVHHLMPQWFPASKSLYDDPRKCAGEDSTTLNFRIAAHRYANVMDPYEWLAEAFASFPDDSIRAVLYGCWNSMWRLTTDELFKIVDKAGRYDKLHVLWKEGFHGHSPMHLSLLVAEAVCSDNLEGMKLSGAIDALTNFFPPRHRFCETGEVLGDLVSLSSASNRFDPNTLASWRGRWTTLYIRALWLDNDALQLAVLCAHPSVTSHDPLLSSMHVLEQLLTEGLVDIDGQFQCQSLLTWACASDRDDIVQLLLRFGIGSELVLHELSNGKRLSSYIIDLFVATVSPVEALYALIPWATTRRIEAALHTLFEEKGWPRCPRSSDVPLPTVFHDDCGEGCWIVEVNKQHLMDHLLHLVVMFRGSGPISTLFVSSFSADPNSVDPVDGLTPIERVAAYYEEEDGHVAGRINLLCSLGADPRRVDAKSGMNALHRAVTAEAVAALLSQGVCPFQQDAEGCTPLHRLLHHGHFEAASRLFSASLPECPKIWWMTNSPAGKAVALDTLITADWYSTTSERSKLLVWLRDFVAPVDALFALCWQPFVTSAFPVLYHLIKQGVDVNARDAKGRTPLHLVTSGVVAAALVSAGANVSATDMEGQTPMHSAGKLESDAVLELLLIKGGSPKARDKHGRTPIFFASKQCAVLLLKICVDAATAQDDEGMTPLQFAIQRQAPLAVSVLQRHSSVRMTSRALLDPVFSRMASWPVPRLPAYPSG